MTGKPSLSLRGAIVASPHPQGAWVETPSGYVGQIGEDGKVGRWHTVTPSNRLVACPPDALPTPSPQVPRTLESQVSVWPARRLPNIILKHNVIGKDKQAKRYTDAIDAAAAPDLHYGGATLVPDLVLKPDGGTPGKTPPGRPRLDVWMWMYGVTDRVRDPIPAASLDTPRAYYLLLSREHHSDAPA